MGLREDLERFREVGEERRQDLSEFIKYGEIDGGEIKIPVKIIDLPEFDYDKWDMGGVGQGEGDVGDPVDVDFRQPGEEEDEGEPGEESGEHGYYEMEPEEFAEELEDELGLDLDPKGKKVKEEVEGALVDLARSGPDSTLDFERMYKKGLKRSLAMYFDEEYVREVLKVEGMGVQKVFEWARNKNIPVSKGWLEQEYSHIPPGKRQEHASIDDIDREMRSTPIVSEIDSIPLRREDKRHKYPEITKEYEKNAVVAFIRDVSGSMRKPKRELVERVFTPLDWYLQGKYDEAKFIYIAHDSEAWEVDREDFFGIKSSGGTKISSAYALAKEILDSNYPWSEWNRYVFAAGDGENRRNDSEEEVIPLMEDISVNLHGYLEVTPGRFAVGNHGKIVDDHFDEDDNVAVVNIEDQNEVTDAIYEILSTEDQD